MIYDQWDVVVVPFPFLEKPATKKRPALVLSKRSFNETNGHTLLAMITSSTRNGWPSDVKIVDLEKAGLKIDCKIRWKVFTLPNMIIDRGLGRLATSDLTACKKAMSEMFHL